MRIRNTAAALLAAVTALGAASCGSIDVSPSTSKVVEKTISIGETESLDIRLNVSKLNVRLGDKNEVHYRVCEEIEPKISEKDGVLSVKVPDNIHINFSGSDEDNFIDITLTEKKLEDINVKLSSGSAHFDGLDLDGKIRSSSGSIGIKNSANGGDIDLEASSGSVSIADSKFRTITEVTSSGSAYIENAAADKIDLRASSGSVRAELSELCDSKLKCSSGSIYLTLPGKENDCNFDLKVSSGDIDFNGETYEKKYKKDNGRDATFTCEASSGDINVSFR